MKHYQQIKDYDWADDYQSFNEAVRPFAQKKSDEIQGEDLVKIMYMLVQEITYLNQKVSILGKALVEVERAKKDKSKIIT